MKDGALKIGELAAAARVGAKTIRFYEATGVLAPPRRGANGYRLYAPDAVEVVRFVKQAQGLGLTLDEIKEVITIRRGGRPPCRHVHRLLKEKAGELDRKLRDLLELRRRVRQSLAAWQRAPSGKAAVCPHIESRSIDHRRRVVVTLERRRPHAAE
jgi:DNA-binding transcriptional MerR regulator